jgi:hypothetical protein
VLTETLNDLHEMWRQHDPSVNLRDLTFAGPHQDPVVYLAERGWITHDANLTDLFVAAGRPVPAAREFPESSGFMRFLTGIRT